MNKNTATVQAADARAMEAPCANDLDTEAKGAALTLPKHSGILHGAANVALLRSPLFGVANRNIPRINYRLAPVAHDRVTGEMHRVTPPFQPEPFRMTSLDGVAIEYAGEELRQDDLSVALHLVQLRQQEPQDEFFGLKPYAALRELGWSDNKNSAIRLGQSIVRMGECSLTASSSRTGEVAGARLIDAYSANFLDNKTPWLLKLGSTLSILLDGKSRIRYLRHATRRALPPFAQWLYGFIATQDKERFMPRAIPLQTLFRMAGMNVAPGTFAENRRRVREAMELLARGSLESPGRCLQDGAAAAELRNQIAEFSSLAKSERQSGQSRELRALTASALSQARAELKALMPSRTVHFAPGVADDWRLTGSTLNFRHI